MKTEIESCWIGFRISKLVPSVLVAMGLLAVLVPATAMAQAGLSLWTNRYNSPGNDSDSANAAGVDGRGNVNVAGGSTGVGTGLDFTTIKYAGIPPPAPPYFEELSPVFQFAPQQ